MNDKSRKAMFAKKTPTSFSKQITKTSNMFHFIDTKQAELKKIGYKLTSTRIGKKSNSDGITRTYTRNGSKDFVITNVLDSGKLDQWRVGGGTVGVGAKSTVVYGNYLVPQKAVLVYRKLFKNYNITTEKQWETFAKSNKKLLKGLKLPTNPLDIYTLENAKKFKRYS